MSTIINDEILLSVRTDHFQAHKSMHESMPGEEMDYAIHLDDELIMPKLELYEIMKLEKEVLKRNMYIDDDEKLRIIKEILYDDNTTKISYLRIREYVFSQFYNEFDGDDLMYRIKKVLDPKGRLSIQLID